MIPKIITAAVSLVYLVLYPIFLGTGLGFVKLVIFVVIINLTQLFSEQLAEYTGKWGRHYVSSPSPVLLVQILLLIILLLPAVLLLFFQLDNA